MSLLQSLRLSHPFLLAVPAALLLAACSAPPPDEQEAVSTEAQQAADAAAAPADEAGKATEAPPVGSCDASQAQGLVGQTYTDALGSQAQQDASAQELRVLRPDDMTTMEFVGERLNVELDEKNVVSGVRCG
ncbi:I78 family peptidase inhibitor [Stenotrophomonas sp. C3(2023)]|uniref:I78 family peptidase inhibitor n=1 Tax=Stenotrophomonas sp. C3(2023) TaxID=3080277 RepID=UPI00293CB4AC|nr:I78 family peptidase inhibitor [Stenotrophomonas sp. C3(2023)]MDV3467253.1 I78 family peptidase inhibitor [Stenotrophomonas sp. C3(2023)]